MLSKRTFHDDHYTNLHFQYYKPPVLVDSSCKPYLSYDILLNILTNTKGKQVENQHTTVLYTEGYGYIRVLSSSG